MVVENQSIDQKYKLWVLLHQARDALFNAREKELSQYGITTMESGAIFIIKTLGKKATPAEIARWMYRQHHTVSALLNRMERKELITKTRVEQPGKKKGWVIGLTDKGETAYHQSTKRESIYGTMSTLSEHEFQQLELLLLKLRDEGLKQAVTVRKLPFP
jgi:DNA-binding MarR family transcriptional regulator